MNSRNGIIKYEPLCIITTFSKKKYYIKAKNRGILEDGIEKKKFIKIGDSTLNVASIDTIDPATTQENFIESELEAFDFNIRHKVKYEIELYKSKHHKDVTPGVLKNIIAKVLP